MHPMQLTKELVAFESPSHLSNREISQFVADRLRSLGFDVELDTYLDKLGVEKVNVIGCKEPLSARGVGLAYFCHSDVVPAAEWTGPGEAFRATERGGRLYGRGSCDMKGSAAAMLSALDRSKHQPLRAPLYFACTADEEISYVGARHLVANSRMYREMVQQQPRTVIGEPTQLQVVHAHKGICSLVIRSRGQAAHSSSSDGLNANLAMIPFLQELKRVLDETESDVKWQNQDFDPPTLSLNIRMHDGGGALNVKAAESTCTVFFRPLPDVDDRPLRDRLRNAAENLGLEFEMPTRCGAVHTDAANPFVVEALEITGKETSTTVPYGTDAGELTELKNKIVCGPGNIAQAHTSDEWIDLRQLEAGSELYERFLRRWCL